MISITSVAKNVEKFAIDNSPVVLTAVGAAGVVTTGVLAAKGGIKAGRILQKAEDSLEATSAENSSEDEQTELPKLSNIDKATMVWSCFLPAVGSGVVSTAAVIASTKISSRRAAALAAAYSLSEKRIDEYQKKIVEKFGENKEREVLDDIQQDRVNRDYDSTTIIMNTGNQLCYEGYSGRFFMSDVETIRAAVNEINKRVLDDGYASLGDFYSEIGLAATDISDELGWQGEKLLDVRFSTVMSPDNKPAIAIEYRSEPVRDYFRMG